MLFVTYYGLREALAYAAAELEALNYNIVDVPFFALDKPIKEVLEDHSDTIVLFWCFAIDHAELRTLRQVFPEKIFVMFNWDDPHSWSVSEMNLPEKASCLDVVFTCCEESTKWYRQNGSLITKFVLPGYKPLSIDQLKDDYYACDVSICLTNLYEDQNTYSNQLIRRKDLVDTLAQMPDISFKIYGPENLKEKYPDNYVGFIGYHDLGKVFHNSKINICTHVDGRFKYANERSVLITGSKGLLLVDSVPQFEEIYTVDECVFLDIHNPQKQIRKILQNYDKYYQIIENGYQKSLQNYTWAHWAATVDKTLKSVF